jgi:glycosyltransferase involved in cell wall biosynthesis
MPARRGQARERARPERDARHRATLQDWNGDAMRRGRKRERLLRRLKCPRAHCPETARQPCWLRGAEGPVEGLDVFGFFLAETGLGNSARSYVEAAISADIPTCAVLRALPGRDAERTYADRVAARGRHEAALYVDGLVGFGDLTRQICRVRRNIALPLWELEAVPEGRVRNLSRFDALWAPSTFVRDNLAAATGRPVELVPHPLQIPGEEVLKTGFSGPLRILFFFDFDSFPARKNPEAAVRAFQAAFAGSEDVRMTVKTRGAEDAGRRAWLSEQAARDPRIDVVDRTLTAEAMAEVMRAHDVFLSLHRSEGFGLGCAEALTVGNIVVATDYGGTRDFVSEETGFPVSWTRVPVAPGAYIEAEGADWADPSVEHAAQHLRRIYDAPEEARRRALKGREALRRSHSIAAVGARMRAALDT